MSITTAHFGSSSQLLSQFDAEWRQLRRQHDSIVSLWAYLTPALEHLSDLDELLVAARDDDLVPQALVRLAADGESVAASCLLHAVLPHLVQTAHAHQNSLGELLTPCWLAIDREVGSYRITGQLAPGVLARLLGRARRTLRNERSSVVLIPLADPGAGHCHIPIGESEVHATRDIDADAVLAVARRLRLLPSPTINVATEVFRDGMDLHEVAARHRSSYEMVRYRTTTAISVLRAHVDELRAALEEYEARYYWENDVCA